MDLENSRENLFDTNDALFAAIDWALASLSHANKSELAMLWSSCEHELMAYGARHYHRGYEDGKRAALKEVGNVS